MTFSRIHFPYLLEGPTQHEYAVYVLFGLILSAIILVLVLAFTYVMTKFDALPFIFSHMFKRRYSRLWCFDLDITTVPHRRTITKACRWLVWTNIVVLLAYFWQMSVIDLQSIKLDQDRVRVMVKLCEDGYDCFAHYDYLAPAVFWRALSKHYFLQVCPVKEEALNNLIRDDLVVYFTCCKFIQFDGLKLITTVAIASALHQLLTIFFQMYSALLYNLRRKWVVRVSFIVAALLLLSILLVSFLSPVVRLNQWLEVIMYCSLPVIMIFDGIIARSLLQLRAERIAMHQKAVNELPIQALFEDWTRTAHPDSTTVGSGPIQSTRHESTEFPSRGSGRVRRFGTAVKSEIDRWRL